MATLDRLQKHTKDENGCWIWQGAVNADGQPRVNGFTYGSPYARQAAYQLAGGELKKACKLKNTCSNLKCINPAHLQYDYTASQLMAEFLQQVHQDGPVPKDKPHLGKCHVWLGCVAHDNRGYLNREKWGETIAARWIYKTVNHLELPSTVTVNHRCNNPICVNPSHLYHNEEETWNHTNLQQAIEEKRLHKQKFTPQEVKQVRELILAGERTSVLCKMFDCSKVTIADIKFNRSFHDPTYTPPER